MISSVQSEALRQAFMPRIIALAVLDLALRGRAGEEHPQLGFGVHVALRAWRLLAE